MSQSQQKREDASAATRIAEAKLWWADLRRLEAEEKAIREGKLEEQLVIVRSGSGGSRLERRLMPTSTSGTDPISESMDGNFTPKSPGALKREAMELRRDLLTTDDWSWEKMNRYFEAYETGLYSDDGSSDGEDDDIPALVSDEDACLGAACSEDDLDPSDSERTAASIARSSDSPRYGG